MVDWTAQLTFGMFVSWGHIQFSTKDCSFHKVMQWIYTKARFNLSSLEHCAMLENIWKWKCWSLGFVNIWVYIKINTNGYAVWYLSCTRRSFSGQGFTFIWGQSSNWFIDLTWKWTVSDLLTYMSVQSWINAISMSKLYTYEIYHWTAECVNACTQAKTNMPRING